MRERAVREPALVGALHGVPRPRVRRINQLDPLHRRERQRRGEARRRRARRLDRRDAALARLGQFRWRASASFVVKQGIVPFERASPAPARTLPEADPIMPRPLVSSYAPVSSSASPNFMRFCSLRSSVIPYASFAFLALCVHQHLSSGGRASSTDRFPPRRFLTCSSGRGNALTTLLGGGLDRRSISRCSLPTISSPNEPSGCVPAISIRAARATLAPTFRCAFMRSSALVFCTIGHA